MTLVEQLVVVTAVAALVVFGIPAVKQLFNTMETPAGAKSVIGSALSTAKALAVKHQQYVGIRFQHAYSIDDPDSSVMTRPQYMVFIKYRPPGSIDTLQTEADLFTVISGIEPIKLPTNIGVMDLYINQQNYDPINDNALEDPEYLTDAATFSIIFSPNGKIIVRNVQVRNRDNEISSNVSEDDIFNTLPVVEDEFAIFLQDDYPSLGLETEPSRRSFILYNRNDFASVDPQERYSEYIEENLDSLTVYINPYTGTMVNR